jgi:excisionase family DNA binding protein
MQVRPALVTRSSTGTAYDGSPLGGKCDDRGMAEAPRFLTLADVAEVLNTSMAQVYALVRRGELEAIRIGGRGQWRVETTKLEEYIERAYADTKEHIAATPFVDEHSVVEPTPKD